MQLQSSYINTFAVVVTGGNSKESYEEQIVDSTVLVTLPFSSTPDPTAFLSTFQCTKSTRSHKSEPELNTTAILGEQVNPNKCATTW